MFFFPYLLHQTSNAQERDNLKQLNEHVFDAEGIRECILRCGSKIDGGKKLFISFSLSLFHLSTVQFRRTPVEVEGEVQTNKKFVSHFYNMTLCKETYSYTYRHTHS